MVEKQPWKEDFSIGNENVDRDHKEILKIAHSLINLIENGKDNNQFAIILTKMHEYAFRHFQKEENYLRSMEYPNLEAHQKLHRDYIYRISKYNMDLISDNPPNPKEVFDYVVDWWENHIQQTDKNYEEYKKVNNLTAEY